MTLAALAAWYVLVAVRAPDYLWTFLWQHNLGRFIGRALAGHHEPIWFYLWVLPVTFLPWTLFLPGALHRAARRARRGERLAIFLLVWCAVPFVFFSLSRAKLATYLLPIFPALALLTATYLDRVLRAPAPVRARALAIPALVWMLGMAAVAVRTPLGVAVAYGGYARSALPTLLLAAFSLLGWHAFRRARWSSCPPWSSPGHSPRRSSSIRVGAPVVDDFSSLRDAALVARELPATAPVFAYKTRGHSLHVLRRPEPPPRPFARGRRRGLGAKHTDGGPREAAPPREDPPVSPHARMHLVAEPLGTRAPGEHSPSERGPGRASFRSPGPRVTPRGRAAEIKPSRR